MAWQSIVIWSQPSDLPSARIISHHPILLLNRFARITLYPVAMAGRHSGIFKSPIPKWTLLAAWAETECAREEERMLKQLASLLFHLMSPDANRNNSQCHLSLNICYFPPNYTNFFSSTFSLFFNDFFFVTSEKKSFFLARILWS